MGASFAAFFLFVAGLCVGSFLNVIIFRFGFSERNARRSRCMACDRELLWYDLVPILSFFFLRGRCRKCGSALSLQYPLVELGVGTLFLLSFLIVPPVLLLWSLVAFVALLIFLTTLTGLVVYDLRHTLVPLPFIWILFGAALVASFSESLAGFSFTPVLDGAFGGVALFIFFMSVVLLTRGRGMGAGDAYVAASIGVLLGFFRGIEAIMIGVWSATIIGLLGLLLSSLSGKIRLFPKGLHVTMKTELPLIPFLAFGTAVALFTTFSPIADIASLSNMLFFGHP